MLKGPKMNPIVECGHHSVNKSSQNHSAAAKQGSIVHSEPNVSGNPAGFALMETCKALEGDAGLVNVDQIATDSGILAWASRRVSQRLQVREWAQNSAHLKRGFPAKSNGSLFSDIGLPCNRWIGKSVRQIRERNCNLGLATSGNIMHEQGKELLHCDKDRDDADRMVGHESELDEKCEANASTKGFVEELQEHDFSEGDLKIHKTTSVSSAGHDEGGKVNATLETQVAKVECGPGKRRSDELNNLVKSGVPKVSETWDGSYNNIVCLPIQRAKGNLVDTAIAQSVDIVHEGVNGITSKSSIKKDSHDPVGEDKKETYNDVITSFIFQTVSSNKMADRPSLAEKTVLDLPKGNHLNFEGDKVQSYSNRYVSAGFRFCSTSLSSSQESSIVLDGSPSQRISHYQGLSEGRSSESSESIFSNHCYNSQSMTKDSEMPSKSGSHKENVRRSSYGSSSPNETSTFGSSKGLKNSSWDEIFKGRLKAEELKNFEEDKNCVQMDWLSSNEDTYFYPLFGKNYKTSDDFLWTSDYGKYTSSYRDSGCEEDNHHSKKDRMLLDAGLDRVNEVLVSLQIAKQHVEKANEHAIPKFRNSSQTLLHSNTYYPLPYFDSKQMQPFLYESGDKNGRIDGPTKPLRMQYCCGRCESVHRKADKSRSVNRHPL